jgi:hypothetical protein
MLSGGALVYHLAPSSGRHTSRPTGRKIDEPVSISDTEDTIVHGQLYGVADVINGYDVGGHDYWDDESYEDPDIGARPYLLYYWKRRDDAQRTTELTAVQDEDDVRSQVPELVAA